MARRTSGRPINDAEYLAERAVDHAKCMRALKRLDRMIAFAFVSGEGYQLAAAAGGLLRVRKALESVDPSAQKEKT